MNLFAVAALVVPPSLGFLVLFVFVCSVGFCCLGFFLMLLRTFSSGSLDRKKLLSCEHCFYAAQWHAELNSKIIVLNFHFKEKGVEQI